MNRSQLSLHVMSLHVIAALIAVPLDVAANPIVGKLKASAKGDLVEYSKQVLCDEPVPGLVVSSSTKARYKILKSGRLTLDLEAPASTIAFEGSQPVVKLRTIPDGGDSKTIACGSVTPGKIYELPPQDSKLVAASIFDLVEHDAKYLTEYRTKALADLRQVERGAIHAEPSLEHFVTATRVALLRPDDQSIKTAQNAATKVRTSLDKIEQDFSCATVSSSGRLEPAICDEAFALDATIASLNVMLGHVADAKPEDRAKVIQLEKPSEALASINPKPPLTSGARRAQCEGIKRYRWLNLNRVPRLLTVASLPTVEDVNVGEYGHKAKAVTAATSDIDRGFVVTNVPFGQKTKFAELQGDRTTLAAGTLFSTFWGQAQPHLLPSFASARSVSATLKGARDGIAKMSDSSKRALGAELVIGVDSQRLSDAQLLEAIAMAANVAFDEARGELLVEAAESQSFVCVEEQGKAEDLIELLVDADLPASSNFEHHAYIFAVDRDHKMSVALCEGADCTGKDDDKQVRTRLSLTPSRACTFTLLAEVSAGVGLDGFDSMSSPEFKPILGPDGPDQIYVMQRTANPADAISTSLLLAVHYSDTSLIALGPSLTTGTSGNAFKQWALRWGRHLGSSGLVFTAGASIRALPFPDDYKLGDRVSVPRGMTTKPPDVRTSFRAEYQVEIGLAFDLAGISSLASDAYKAIGGK